MRCCCCNRNLSDYESCLKHPLTGEYLDICTTCLEDIPIEPVEPINHTNNVGYVDDGDDLELNVNMDWSEE